MKEAVIVSAARTAVGRAKRGTLVDVRPDEMAAVVIKEALKRAEPVKAEDVEDVIVGCAFPEGEQGMNVARIALLRAGLPYLLLIGFAAAVMMICYAMAVKLAIVPYVIALKRTNGLFSVLFGLLLFREGRITQSLFGAGIMFAGVLLIVLSG